MLRKYISLTFDKKAGTSLLLQHASSSDAISPDNIAPRPQPIAQRQSFQRDRPGWRLCCLNLVNMSSVESRGSYQVRFIRGTRWNPMQHLLSLRRAWRPIDFPTYRAYLKCVIKSHNSYAMRDDIPNRYFIFDTCYHDYLGQKKVSGRTRQEHEYTKCDAGPQAKLASWPMRILSHGVHHIHNGT